jgi:hypothetical protein
MKTDSIKDTQLSLRLDEKLRRQIAAAAERSMRSLNGEIVYRLRSTFEHSAEAAPPA